jgi:two-component system, chemotaxis family, protein-glutamate methylesterase/glutaminase
VGFSTPLRGAEAPVRVVLADDSAVVRGMTTRWLTEDAGVALVGTAVNGRDAVRLAGSLKPEVMILDVEMPEMDGLTAIPEILRASPHTRILMASTLTQQNAETTVRALSLGATDCVAKPSTGRIAGADDYRRDLLNRVKGLGARRVPVPVGVAPRPAPAAKPAGVAPARRVGPAAVPEVVVLGCSTGGPQALQAVVPAMIRKLSQPLLIVQHMPAMFTAILAQHLAKSCGVPVMEAKDGMPVKPGQVLIAPGDYHMRLARRHGALVAAVDQGPPVNFCRPAVDPLFFSAAELCGERALAIVLTGMGSDGKKGAEALVAKGAGVLVQDEATSVVWGMPGAVAQAGLAGAIKPLSEIAGAALAYAQGKGHFDVARS